MCVCVCVCVHACVKFQGGTISFGNKVQMNQGLLYPGFSIEGFSLVVSKAHAQNVATIFIESLIGLVRVASFLTFGTEI